MKMSKVGNQTNSQDPQAVNSRVFVGNLNTFQCSKTDVERMFQRYGRLAGISMHKGYAFVQFTNPFDARSACLGEDGRTVLSQVLDVNMVAEPKLHQIGRKQQNIAKNGNDWDFYYDSYYSQAAMPPGPPRLAPPLKRPRLTSVTSRNTKVTGTAQKVANISVNNEQIKVYSNPDILICGNCREMFTDLHELLEHKKTYCKLRFTCKCHTLSDHSQANGDDQTATTLQCVQCKDSFVNAWDLMVHAQAAHMLNIYELGIPRPANGINAITNGDNSVTNGDNPVTNGDNQVTNGIDQVTNGINQVTNGGNQVNNEDNLVINGNGLVTTNGEQDDMQMQFITNGGNNRIISNGNGSLDDKSASPNESLPLSPQSDLQEDSQDGNKANGNPTSYTESSITGSFDTSAFCRPMEEL